MKKPSLKKEILNFMQSKTDFVWFRKVSLYAEFEDWSPETVGRYLREMAEEDKTLEVGYYDGKYAKNLAKYKLKGAPPKKQIVEFIDNVAHIRYE